MLFYNFTHYIESEGLSCEVFESFIRDFIDPVLFESFVKTSLPRGSKHVDFGMVENALVSKVGFDWGDMMDEWYDTHKKSLKDFFEEYETIHDEPAPRPARGRVIRPETFRNNDIMTFARLISVHWLWWVTGLMHELRRG